MENVNIDNDFDLTELQFLVLTSQLHYAKSIQDFYCLMKKHSVLILAMICSMMKMKKSKI